MRIKKTHLYASLATIVVVFGLFAINITAPSQVECLDCNLRSTSTTEFYNLIDSEEYEVIDIRTPEEFRGGKIANAINIDFYSPQFRSDLDKLDKDKKYAIYCRSGSRSGQALSIMSSLGFKNVVNLENGINSWITTGYPIE